MTLILFHLLLKVATAQSAAEIDRVQAIVDRTGRELVYSEGVYILPVRRLAELAFAQQFLREHAEEFGGLRVVAGPVDPALPRYWMRPHRARVYIYDGDAPLFQDWPVPDDPQQVHRLVKVTELIDTARGERLTALERLRARLVRQECGEEFWRTPATP